MKYKILKLKERKHPICPECGQATIVVFAPPKEGMYCNADDKNWEKVDIQKTHLYCCNGEKNCKFNTRIQDLTTPLTHYQN